MANTRITFRTLNRQHMDSETHRIASHYNSRPDRGVEYRKKTVIKNVKNFNNWVKAILINMNTREGDRAFDLCCGKGGDLKKWSVANVSHLVGVGKLL